MKTCSKCKEKRDDQSFHFRDASRGIQNKVCKSCMADYRRQHYLANRNRLLKRAKDYRAERRTESRDFVSQYLSEHPCEMCGIKDVRVLEFDHISPATKNGNISQMVHGGTLLKTIKKEIGKCRVLCKNCHSIHTGEQFGWWKSTLGR